MPETTHTENTNGTLEGFTQAEMTMIRRLAGNDPEIRKKTMKKLRKWLTVICKRIPDSPESRKICEPNFIRVWKALFYCMWMADKPVPQENLAEQISNLVSIFQGKPHVMMLFTEWFLITMAREWPWIDRLRMDKFKMLVRRFLRKTFTEFSKENWDSDLLDSFNKLIHVHLFNHHVPPPKTRAKSRNPDPIKAPLGLQIHIVDIYLEELAKVGGDGISNETILKTLEPFIDELCANDDQRLLDEIKERVFHHLMRQSDVGIEFQESRGGKYVRLELDEDDLEDEDVNEGDDEVIQPTNGQLDPRAGQVDVILPQLQIKYEDLIHSLTEAGGRKTTKMKNRKFVYILAREFQKLTTGEYPLGVPYVNDSRVPAIPRKEVENAAKRLLEFEQNIIEPKDKKKKKKNKKNKLAPGGLSDSIGSEDNSVYLNDSELTDHVGDNYQSYLVEMGDDDPNDEVDNHNEVITLNNHKMPKRKKQKSPGVDVVADNVTSPSPVKSKSPKLKRKSISSDIPATNETDNKPKKLKRKSLSLQPGGEVDNLGEKALPLKKRKSLNVEIRENGHSEEFNKSLSEAPNPSKMQQNKLKRKSLPSKLDNSPKETYITIKRKNLSKPIDEMSTSLKENITSGSSLTTPININNIRKPETPLTPSGLKKKVNFVLAKNLEHPHNDYPLSIQRSPAIPYDSKKRPSFGLLKSPAGRSSLTYSPKTTPRKISPIPRKKASEFFQ